MPEPDVTGNKRIVSFSWTTPVSLTWASVTLSWNVNHSPRTSTRGHAVGRMADWPRTSAYHSPIVSRVVAIGISTLPSALIWGLIA
jgi:hypothetical protein